MLLRLVFAGFLSLVLGIFGGIISNMDPVGMAYVMIIFWVGMLLKNVMLPPPSRTAGYYGGF